MKGKIWRFLTGRSGAVLGIDIGTGTVKLVELDPKKGKPLLKSAGIVSLPDCMLKVGADIDCAALSDTIRQAIASSGATSHEAVLAISSKAVFVRELSFPFMTEDELKEAIKWDVENYVPYPPNSYYYDFSIINSETGSSDMKVLLVAAPQEIVNLVSKAVQDVGLRLIAVDIEPLAIYRTLNGAENALLVDIGAAVSQITLFQNGTPVLTRDIDIGGQRFTEEIMQALGLNFAEAERLKQRQEGLLKKPNDEESASILQQQLEMLIAELVREIRRTAEYYQMQHQGVVFDHLIVSGGGAKLDNLLEHFTVMLEDMHITIHDPLHAIDVNPSFDPEYIQKMSVQLSIAAGLALYGGHL